ncbi:MAG: helix-turn-helix transcriptional regulator [Clostridia bacterium]|nr:helix-turn-helix transcriptional regulator [Clostridia bacterium]
MDNIQMAETIKQLCKTKEITVKLLLGICDINRNFMYDLKNNKKPSVETLEKIADYFNVSVDYLLGREKPKTFITDCDDEADEREQHLLSNYKKLTEQAQHTLVDYSDFMISKPENLKDTADTDQMIS